MTLIQTKLCEKIDLNFLWAFHMRENKDESLSPVTQQPKTRQLSLGLGISVDVQVDLLARGMSATVSTKSSGAPRLLGMGIPAWVIERRRRVLVLSKQTRLQGNELAQNGNGIHHHQNLEQEQ